jgi:hypothetical protein
MTMRRNIFAGMIFLGVAFFCSCRNEVKTTAENSKVIENKIEQQSDGTISLKVDSAECYHDNDNPSTNTAEWNVSVKKSGRFDVWLSSSTKDTTNLKYKNSVMLSFLDNRLEARPACDKIVQNSDDVSLPYFRADSFIGSLYIQDTGVYNIQVISEKILPKDYANEGSSAADNSKLLSVILLPVTR